MFRGLCCRALRVVNPSPYMFYLQARGSILVASSPEILCHVGEDRTVTNRCPLPARPHPWPSLHCQACSSHCWRRSSKR